MKKRVASGGHAPACPAHRLRAAARVDRRGDAVRRAAADRRGARAHPGAPPRQRHGGGHPGGSPSADGVTRAPLRRVAGAARAAGDGDADDVPHARWHEARGAGRLLPSPRARGRHRSLRPHATERRDAGGDGAREPPRAAAVAVERPDGRLRRRPRRRAGRHAEKQAARAAPGVARRLAARAPRRDGHAGALPAGAPIPLRRVLDRGRGAHRSRRGARLPRRLDHAGPRDARHRGRRRAGRRFGAGRPLLRLDPARARRPGRAAAARDAPGRDADRRGGQRAARRGVPSAGRRRAC